MGAVAEAEVQSPREEEIRRALERVLSSSVFRGSKRCRDFTNYVCSKALEGDAETLKERTLAVDVFGRKFSEDLSADNIVRVGAREVRSRLALYYTGEGKDEEVRIGLPTGSYVPVFSYRPKKLDDTVAHLHEVEEKAVVAIAPPELDAPASRRSLWLFAIVAVIVLAAVGWIVYRPATTAFQTFWKPAFDSSAPALLVMPHPIVYQPSARALMLDMQLNGKPDLAVSRAINLPPNQITGSDFVPVFNQYIGFGDAVAALSTYSILASHGRTAILRQADKIEFNDLYGSTVVLIGASFANRWTAEITKGFRYQFRFEGQSKPWIVDSQSDQKWGLAAITDDRRTMEDYILLCRIPQSQTGKLMIVVGGLAGFGTEAGGRIIADPKLFEPILSKLPPNWESHNLEAVMKVQVVGEGPMLPNLVVAHVW